MRMLCCRGHWFALPAKLRMDLSRTYHRDSRAHLSFFRDAIRLLSRMEVRPRRRVPRTARHAAHLSPQLGLFTTKELQHMAKHATHQSEGGALLTLGDVEEYYGVRMLEHLDREAELPTFERSAMQGDVSILRVTTAPATTPIPKEGVAVVVGENGGNTHSLHGDGFFDPVANPRPGSLKLGTLTVPADGEAFLLHPEHGGLRAEGPGTFDLGRQREFAGEWRMVRD
jgi:hypothetical protein